MQNATGIPLKDRSPGDIERTLADKGEDVVNWALKLHKYAVEKHLGISQIAHQANIGSGILSPFFNGTYTGDFNAIAERIEQFFWRLEQKEKYGGLRQFVDTALSRALRDTFEKTRITRRIQLIESPEQCGKTRTGEVHTEENNSGRTKMTSLSGGARSSVSTFIWDWAERLGIPYSIKLAEKRVRIRQILATCDLVIIDELHLLWDWTPSAIADWLNYLRTDIHANGARGVVLMATNSDSLARLGSFRKRAGYNVGQLIGRMRNQPMRIDPAEDIIEADVRLLVERYFKPRAETVRKLHRMCIQEQLGHFGLLDDILNESWTRAKARKKDLSDEIVLATAEESLAAMRQHETDLFK
jgi:DNA transposition AAA+ family ATPase